MTKAQREQLEQIRDAGRGGVEAGDLINKTATRLLVRGGLVDNEGGDASSLSRVRINRVGLDALRHG